MTTEEQAQKAQNFLNRGRQSLEARRFDAAVDLLLESLKFAPDVVETRRLLRAAQIARFRESAPSSFSLKMQSLSAVFARQKILSLAKKGNGVEAMAEAEKLLTQNPLDPNNIECFVKAAEAAGKPEAAAVTVEAAYECNQSDPTLLERVANYYVAANNFARARDAYVKLSQIKPNDQRVRMRLKDLEARATISGGWEQNIGKRGGYRGLIANKDQAEKLDQANKAVISGSDADSLIEEKLRQIEREPANMNYYRALARLYMQNKRFEEAVAILEKAQSINSMDPELDRMLSSARTAYYDWNIEELRKAGRNEEADETEAQREQFIFDDLAARVERYPNDLHLRYELGRQYYKYDYFDEAIVHLQLAQKSPKDRLDALYCLAMCFLKKGQRDMGVMQLETARDQLPQMNELKKNVIYQLGICAEESGDLEKAYNYYKDIYSTDVTFADVGDRMMDLSKRMQPS